MSEVKYKTQPILYVIALFVIANLIATCILIGKMSSSVSSTVIPSDQQSLPSGLQTQDERMALFVKIQEAFNANSLTELRDMLDPIATMEQSAEEFEYAIESVIRLTGNILEGTYSHYEVDMSSHDIRTYQLIYKLTGEKGKGILTVTIIQQGTEPYRIYGFNIRVY